MTASTSYDQERVLRELLAEAHDRIRELERQLTQVTAVLTADASRTTPPQALWPRKHAIVAALSMSAECPRRQASPRRQTRQS